MTNRTAGSLDRIVQDPSIPVGLPTVRGTRIPVELALGQLAEHFDPADPFAAYPGLTLEDGKACPAYAAAAVSRKRKARPTTSD
jgi:uncharacterized protein (DUF433 family)